MKLSDGEKLILAVLADIHKHLKIQGEIDSKFLIDTLFSGNLWGLSWRYDSLLSSEFKNPPAVEETCDILTMYRNITHSFESLSPAEQQEVKKKTNPFDGYVKFQGFDGNHDEHFGITSYLVNSLGRFDELKPGTLNSHSSGTLDTYRRILKKYKTIEKAMGSRYRNLTSAELIEILTIS